MNREEETACTPPRPSLRLTCSQNPAQGSWWGGEVVVVGVLDWAAGLLHHSPDSPHSPLGLLEHARQTAHVVICDVHVVLHVDPTLH